MTSLSDLMQDLAETDDIVGGTFLESLSKEEVMWSVYKIEGTTVTFDVSWMGVDLGRINSDGHWSWRQPL